MNSKIGTHGQEHSDLLFLYALQALPSNELPAAENHMAGCAECRQELETLRPIVAGFDVWPTDVLRPAESLWERLSHRIAKETGQQPIAVPPRSSFNSEWEEVSSGISVRVLATDSSKNRVSMLVRLDPGTHYPPHRHAGEEELHLLHGELMVDDRKLHPGDYIHAVAGTIDHRVWSETGCTCVLITSTKDEIL